MKDMIMIILITAYFLLSALVLTEVFKDDIIIGNIIYQQNSTNININDITYYTNVSDVTNENIGAGISFIGMFGRLISFRIPTQSEFPVFIIRLIEIANFIMIMVLGLLIYRMFRSGAG